MSPVHRSEILPLGEYEAVRPHFRARVVEEKKTRRVFVGEHVTAVFENHDSVLFQVQEMLRTERITAEAGVQHEIDTYNELLGGEGELGCTLLIEIDDAAERAVKLRNWYGVPEHLYLRVADGTRVRPRVDERQRDDERISSVHYLRFDVHGQVPVAAGCDLPALTLETPLDPAQRHALAEDLGPDAPR